MARMNFVVPGGFVADSTTLIVDDPGNAVGIGMSPTKMLDVNGEGRFASTLTVVANGLVVQAGGANITGTVTASTFSGSGSSLTGVPTTALTGTLQAAQFPAMSGDITVSAGSTTAAITADSIVNADINSAAAIADTKLGTITTANKVGIGALDIDGGTDIGAALVDADLFIVDDGAAGTNRKAAMSRIKDYMGYSAWTTWSPTVTGITAYGTSPTTTYRYTRIGKTVHCYVRIVFGATGSVTFDGARISVTTPTSVASTMTQMPTGNVYVNAFSGTPYVGIVRVMSTGVVDFYRTIASTTDATLGDVTGTAPATLGNLGQIDAAFWYEEA